MDSVIFPARRGGSGWSKSAALAALALAVTGYAGAAANDDPHANHMHPMPPKAAWIKSSVNYKMPEVTLVRADGAKVSLAKELDDGGKPVILNFIYTTCTAICPVMTQTFAEVQNRLGEDLGKVRMVSVSIDPEQDTPQRLKEYAKKYSAGPQWSFYTGSVEASIATQRAFDAYRGDKMNHLPVTFLRAAPGKPWVRLEGFAPPDEVVKEYRQLVAAR
jgi:protein SCO1/2